MHRRAQFNPSSPPPVASTPLPLPPITRHQSIISAGHLSRTTKHDKTQVRKLNAIVQGLVIGLQSCGWIGLLLFLVYYCFAIGAVLFFGENDPLHFRTLPVALLSLFRASTMEDWTDLMCVAAVNVTATFTKCDGPRAVRSKPDRTERSSVRACRQAVTLT